VVVAHLDEMLSRTLAPGADDNYSGSARVLFSKHLFLTRFRK